MPEQPNQVIVAYDFSKSSHAALVRAVEVACRAPWHVLQIVCVIDPHFAFPTVPADDKKIDIRYADKVIQEATKIVTDELGRHTQKGPVHFFIHARIGRAAEEILDVARDVGADLILLGSHGVSGLERFILGSTAERVVREAGCTVEIVKEKTYSFVPLLEVTDTPHSDHSYVPPHRYTYEDRSATRRPNDWPLY